MYIATVPNRKSPPAILLRESYRDNGKVKTRTIANLTHWAPERIEALRKALKGDFDGMDAEAVSGEIFGVLFALKQLADQVGMTRVLGPSNEGRLALFLVLAHPDLQLGVPTQGRRAADRRGGAPEAPGVVTSHRFRVARRAARSSASSCDVGARIGYTTSSRTGVLRLGVDRRQRS